MSVQAFELALVELGRIKYQNGQMDVTIVTVLRDIAAVGVVLMPDSMLQQIFDREVIEVLAEHEAFLRKVLEKCVLV
jgi:hypothetical protein